jgi:hypothetical protein
MNSREACQARYGGLARGPPGGHSICLFLARLLDALLAGVEGSLLALGRIHHVLLGLGI